MALTEGDIETNSPPLAVRMARALRTLDESQLESRVVAKVKLCVLDFLACALSAQGQPWARQAIAVARGHSRQAQVQAASIIGTADSFGISDAAFANAVLGHSLIRDDMHLGSISHLGVVVLPPVLALAETRPVSGTRLIAAIAAGYEAGGKLGRAIVDVDVARIFRPTGTIGPFAGAAAGAALLGLDERRTANALALAANTAAGYNEWAATGGSEMFFHPGFAARNGLTAVELAAAGTGASPSALDGAAGMLAAFGKCGDLPPPLPFADRPEILDVFFKEVPACNFAQTSAQAARDLAVIENLDPADIAAVTVRVPFAAHAYPGCDWPGPFEHALKAKMSIHYNVAAALWTRNFDERNFEPGAQERICALAERVALEVDDALTRAFPARQGAVVIVTRGNGERLERIASDVAPAPDEMVRERFAAAAAAALGDGKGARLREFIDSLERQDDAGELCRLTRTGADRRRTTEGTFP